MLPFLKFELFIKKRDNEMAIFLFKFLKTELLVKTLDNIIFLVEYCQNTITFLTNTSNPPFLCTADFSKTYKQKAENFQVGNNLVNLDK